ncbi:MAG: GntP family permease [Planctomycetaceae bacterium]|nr:GntP family permease [Planctomycetaceae bacterium]
MDSTWVTVGILLAGVVVVIGGVLVLRLHAFLALILGALVVAALTPAAAVESYSLRKNRLRVLTMEEDGRQVVLAVSKSVPLQEGMQLPVLREDESGHLQEAGRVVIDEIRKVELEGGASRTEAVASVVAGDESAGGDFRIAKGDVLIDPQSQVAARSLAGQTIGEQVAEGFGSTCAKIGILIAMASIIGKCLLDSGAADRVVRSALRLLGEKGAPLAFLSSGFLLGIPVFFDTVFYLMIPLGKAMRMRTGRNYLLYVLTIVAGGTMAHSLVPPTPGPLFVAEQLGVDIGLMILAGGFVGIFTAGFGFVYATVANRLWELPLRESADFSLADLEAISQREEKDLPPTWLALLPIVLPVVLIGGYTILKQDAFAGSVSADVLRIGETLGDKNIALLISAAIALLMLVWQKRTSLAALSESVQSSLASGGVIILITAGGGAFGNVLQQTGVSNLISDLPEASPLVIVILAFLITAAIRTAQGSATVAMITSVGILSGIATSGQLGFHPVYLALAIGCGSKPVSWMNDSGFWVVGRMSGMTEAETLKYVTPMTTLMGLVGLAVVLVLVTVYPMV